MSMFHIHNEPPKTYKKVLDVEALERNLAEFKKLCKELKKSDNPLTVADSSFMLSMIAVIEASIKQVEV